MNLFSEELQEPLTPKMEYEYINEKGEKKFHTPRQWKLHDFYKTHNLQGFKNEKDKIEAYHEWLIQYGKFNDYFDYHYQDSREYRKDKYALKYSEVIQKAITMNGILDTFEEAKEVALKQIIKAKKEIKLAYQFAHKVEKHYQTRFVFNSEKDTIEVVRGIEE